MKKLLLILCCIVGLQAPSNAIVVVSDTIIEPQPVVYSSGVNFSLNFGTPGYFYTPYYSTRYYDGWSNFYYSSAIYPRVRYVNPRPPMPPRHVKPHPAPHHNPSHAHGSSHGGHHHRR